MIRLAILAGIALLAVTPVGAEVTTLGECGPDYPACVQQWQQRRVDFLKGEDGYLNLVGLYWLRPGDSSFGSAADNDLVFPAPAAASVGTFHLDEDGVSMSIAGDADVRFAGRRVSRMDLPADTTGERVNIHHGTMSWTIINRAGKYAVRLRNLANPAIAAFGPIERYPIDENFRITARFEPYDEPRTVNVSTVIDGLSYNPTAPGTVRFRAGGAEHELEVYETRGEIFIVFGDLSNRDETYPAGRFLYADMPDSDGNVVLDFNIAQNPPCAFNEFSTCPLPSPRNRLKTRIAAGERFDRAVGQP